MNRLQSKALHPQHHHTKSPPFFQFLSRFFKWVWTLPLLNGIMSKNLWLHIVSPNISHTSASCIWMCLKHSALNSKVDRWVVREKRTNVGGWGRRCGSKDGENKTHGKERKQCTLVPRLQITASPYRSHFVYFAIFLLLGLPWSISVSASAATKGIEDVCGIAEEGKVSEWDEEKRKVGWKMR